jgi:hypothetical protein
LRVAVLDPELYETTPGTGLPPDVGVRVNVDVLILPEFIGSLNVTITSVLTATPVTPFVGDTFITVGGVASTTGADVVNAELKAVSEFPATSFAALVTFTV